MIKCPSCGRDNAENFNFCLDCGYDLKAYRAHRATADTGSPTESMTSEELQAAARSSPAGDLPSTDPGTLVPPSSPTPPPAAAPAVPAPAAAAPETAPPPATAAPASPPLAAPAAPAAPAAAAAAPAAAAAAGMQPCPSCGTDVPVGNKFCGTCGHRQDAGAPAPGAPGGGRTMFMHATDLKGVTREKVCKLVTIDQSGQEGMTFTLKAGETLCGRTNGLVLFYDDPYVSPTHCLFRFAGDTLSVADKGSLNGVFVRVPEERPLAEGDQLRIGRQLFRFEPAGNAGEEVKRPAGDDARIWGSPEPGAFGRLVQILEDGRAGEVRLLAGESCTLGREQGEIVFPTDGFVSGTHCTFYPDGGDVRVKDLGSSNGTYLRVKGSADVGHGDFLLIGNQMLRVEVV